MIMTEHFVVVRTKAKKILFSELVENMSYNEESFTIVYIYKLVYLNYQHYYAASNNIFYVDCGEEQLRRGRGIKRMVESFMTSKHWVYDKGSNDRRIVSYGEPTKKRRLV